MGEAPTLLKTMTSKGNNNYRHSFSKFLRSGFRIKALSGRNLDKNDLLIIGEIILNNENLVRKLISLGWDTLEVHDNMGNKGLQWPLERYANIGGILHE